MHRSGPQLVRRCGSPGLVYCRRGRLVDRVGPECLLNWSVRAAEQTRAHHHWLLCSIEGRETRKAKALYGRFCVSRSSSTVCRQNAALHPLAKPRGPAWMSPSLSRRSHLSAVPLGTMSRRCDLDPELGGEGALGSFRSCLEWRCLMLGWEREEGNRS